MIELKPYVGIKRMKAVPMSKNTFGMYLTGVSSRADDRDGYLVEYTGTGNPNHPDHADYISWSPKDVFEEAYQSTESMSFGRALECLTNGEHICRQGWNGKGMFLTYVEPDCSDMFTTPLVLIRTPDGGYSVWNPSTLDMFATDWCVCEGEI